MTIENSIRQKITAQFQPLYIELENESHTHNVPKGSETHFRLLVVSERFRGLSRIERQRLVNAALADEMKDGVHALSQRTYTPEEWQKLGGAVQMQSPPCHGGRKSR